MSAGMAVSLTGKAGAYGVLRRKNIQQSAIIARKIQDRKEVRVGTGYLTDFKMVRNGLRTHSSRRVVMQ
jgi:hypothetical protein